MHLIYLISFPNSKESQTISAYDKALSLGHKRICPCTNIYFHSFHYLCLQCTNTRVKVLISLFEYLGF